MTDAITNLSTVLLFLGGVLALGAILIVICIAAFIAVRSAAEVQRVRTHRAAADAQDEALDESRDALDDIQTRRRQSREQERVTPSDEELFRQIVEEREWTTTGNEGIEEDSGIPPDRTYNIPEEAIG